MTAEVPDIAAEIRVEALTQYDILDTPPESGFDDIVYLASQLCHTPTALISLLDRDRQWFKARVGFECSPTPMSQSICSHAIASDSVLVIPDLTLDPRTRKKNSRMTASSFKSVYLPLRPGFHVRKLVAQRGDAAMGEAVALPSVPSAAGRAGA